MYRGRVIVLMSGGVDSSVAAALLKEQGYSVVGVTMETWDGDGHSEAPFEHACYGAAEVQDTEDARGVAQVLDIPLHIFDLRATYRTLVLDYVCQEYRSGRTPNPCVRCNARVKLGTLVEEVKESGIEYDYVATGHYARVTYEAPLDRYLLRRAEDSTKDQSYFLYFLSQDQLKKTLFPLGDYTKEEVRRIGGELGLGVSNKPESQDFVAGGYSSLFQERAHPGPILNSAGETLGEHRGIPFYTIGQRRGLGISAQEPLCVVAIDPRRNAIVVGTKEEALGYGLVTSEVNWIAMDRICQPIETKAKIRYRTDPADATVVPLDEGRVSVRFRQPQMAITPGQAVVFYSSDIVVGGGTIEQRLP